MKRFFAILMMSLMLVSMMSFAASAKGSFDTGKTVYNIPEADEISFSYSGVTGVTVVPQKDSTLENLIDGDSVNDTTAFDTHGVVLVRNDYIKPTYEAQKAQAVQSLDAIPKFSFSIKYEDKVTFDALYLSLFQEINHTIATPGGNYVNLETSDNGKDWSSAGTFYYRPHVGEYTGDHHAGNVEEIVVPLGKEIKSSHVRLTFEFSVVPETVPPHFWTYYTNVYEWSGFTELGVAQYKSGDKPVVVTQEQANVPDIKVEGTWVTKTDSLATLYKFESGIVEKKVYSLSDFEEKGIEAEVVSEESGTYSLYINDVTIAFGDIESVYAATLDKDGKLLLDDKFEQLNLEPYTEKTDDAPAGDSTSDEDDNNGGNDGVDYSKPTANNGAVTDKSDDFDGPGIGLIIGIVVGVIAVVAVIVVVVIVLKKKKQ